MPFMRKHSENGEAKKGNCASPRGLFTYKVIKNEGTPTPMYMSNDEEGRGFFWSAFNALRHTFVFYGKVVS